PTVAAVTERVGDLAPPDRRGEAYGWMTTATTGGISLASPLTGWLIDLGGIALGVAGAAALAVLGALLTLGMKVRRPTAGDAARGGMGGHVVHGGVGGAPAHPGEPRLRIGPGVEVADRCRQRRQRRAEHRVVAEHRRHRLADGQLQPGGGPLVVLDREPAGLG